jgi:hypothetical protein
MTMHIKPTHFAITLCGLENTLGGWLIENSGISHLEANKDRLCKVCAKIDAQRNICKLKTFIKEIGV